MLDGGICPGRAGRKAFVVTLHQCPYCSCPLVSVERNEEGGAVVACGSCGMTGPESVDGSEDEAIRGWEALCRRMCRNCRQVYIERIRELRRQLERPQGEG